VPSVLVVGVERPLRPMLPLALTSCDIGVRTVLQARRGQCLVVAVHYLSACSVLVFEVVARWWAAHSWVLIYVSHLTNSPFCVFRSFSLNATLDITTFQSLVYHFFHPFLLLLD
jgi:hypothetical protein